MKNKKTILVTGGGGYIGSMVVAKLLQDNYEVNVLDLFTYGKSIFNSMQNTKGLHLIQADIRDENTFLKNAKNCYAIVHLAGIVGDMACGVDEKLTMSINVASTLPIIEIAKKLQTSRFIFASSCSVYGIAPRVVNEKSKVNPLSLYAQTKIEAEKIILQNAGKNLHPTILRFTTVFGHSLKPRFDLVANLFVAQAYKDGKITVTGGKQWRPFIHVKDVARAICLTLEAPLPKVNRQIFNVGDDRQHYRIIDLAGIINKLVKDKKVEILVNPNPWDKRNYRVSFGKIRKALGFTASISLEKGLKEMYKNFEKNKYTQEVSNPLYGNVEAIKMLKKAEAL